MPTDFQYVPTSGDLPGKAFEDQTEQAFNELGGQIDAGNQTAQDALDAALNAQAVANQALQEVQTAVDAANNAVTAAQNAVNAANQANNTAGIALRNSTEAVTTANTAVNAANDAIDTAIAANTASENAQNAVTAMDSRVTNAQGTADGAQDLALRAYGIYTKTFTARNSTNESGDPIVVQFDANNYTSSATKLYLTVDDSDPALNLPPLNFPSELVTPFYFEVMVNDDQTSATQRAWNTVNDDRLYERTGLFDFTTDSDNPSILWSQWKFIGSDSDLILSGAFLTRIIGGSTSVDKSLFPDGTIFIMGSTIIFDANGTIGIYDTAIDSATISVITRSISPIGADEPTLLGNVNTKADLPTTVSDATTVFGRTPAVGDYAKVLADESKTGSPTVEYYIVSIDGSDNITWGNEVVLNTSDYQAQTTAADAGKMLVGGATPGTYGDSKSFDAAPTDGSQNGILSGAVHAAIQLPALGAAPANITLAENAASDTLPSTTTGPVASKIQALRDNVKSLFSKVGSAIGLGGTPSTQAFGDSAAEGTSPNAARADHKHGMPATPTSISGNAGSATKLATARNLAVNLASTAAALFDGSANQTGIPVSGTLPPGSGGTGVTTLAALKAALGFPANAAPLPQAAAGVGQWTVLTPVAAGSRPVLPPGGTWAYFVIQFNPAGGNLVGGPSGVAYNPTAGVAAGGATVGNAANGYGSVGFAWRIS